MKNSKINFSRLLFEFISISFAVLIALFVNQWREGHNNQNIADKAAEVGSVTVRALMSRPRDIGFYVFPGVSNVWTVPFEGGSHEFLVDGVRLIDARAAFHFYATGITPAMSKKFIGAGSQYAAAYLDHDGNSLDGSVDVYFGPTAPAGQEHNWIQTIPGRGWNMLI